MSILFYWLAIIALWRGLKWAISKIVPERLRQAQLRAEAQRRAL